MSKRFYYDEFSNDIFDEQIDDYPSNFEICEILNKQQQQIEELEQKLSKLKETKVQELANYLHSSIPKHILQDKIELLEKVKEIFESCWDYHFDIGELCNKSMFYDKIEKLIEEQGK